MKSEHKLLSVLMPCYNAGKFLNDAIDSILLQSHSNLELLLINDGSTDNTAEIIAEYISKDPRVVCINNDVNLGLIRSLNKGIGVAKGEYIARMDADDISSNDRLEKLLAAFLTNPEMDVISAGYFYMTDKGKIMQRIFPKAQNSTALKFVSFFCTPVNHPCVMVRANVFKKNLFDEQYIHSEDYEIFSRLLLDGYRFMNLTEPLYYLRKNPESVSFRYEKIQISTHTKISVRNIDVYFQRKFDFFVHKIMINRISFNVSADLLQNALQSLDQLKKEFVQRENPSVEDLKQINEFLTEQKIDIHLQSLKYAHFGNKFRIFISTIFNIQLFFSRRGLQYIRSKYSFNRFFFMYYLIAELFNFQ